MKEKHSHGFILCELCSLVETLNLLIHIRKPDREHNGYCFAKAKAGKGQLCGNSLNI